MPEDPVQFIQLLPVEGDTLLANDELSAVATQVTEAPDLTIAAKPEGPREFGMSWKWNWHTGDFIEYGGAPATCTDLENLEQWCENILNIDRFAHPIYADNIGIEDPYQLIGQATNTLAQTRYVKKAEEALLVHDRITKVQGWEFKIEHQIAPDVLLVKYEIVTDNGRTVPMSLQLPLGE